MPEKAEWFKGPTGYVAHIPSTRWPRPHLVAVRILGGGMAPYRYRTCVNGESIRLRNQGFAKTLAEGKAIGLEYVVRKEEEPRGY